MTSIQPRVGQYVRPGTGWALRPWCRVIATGEDKWGPWFIAEYPDDAVAQEQFRQYKQYWSDHNFRFCEVSNETPPAS